MLHTMCKFQVQVQVFIVLHCFLEKLINILYKNAEIKKYRQLAREKQYLIVYSDQSSQ